MDEVILRLYVTRQNFYSRAAIKTLNKLKKKVDISVEIVDITEDPDLARENHIIAIPTLERIKPEPRRRIIGDLSDEGALLKFIGC
ncbi:MAG: circadian clock protein KaiB [Methanobacteriaceae archaeon]|nr:MAG: KaiB-related protein [Methanobacteriaceae archaeon 41_258]MDI3483810.1 circadian clock protein KaiB [Methanobacteriaceae archaeon]